MKVSNSIVNDESRNKIYRGIALGLILLLVVCIPMFTVIKAIDAGHYANLLLEYGAEADVVKDYEQFEISAAIYKYNCVLCVITVIVQLFYWIPIWKESLLDKKTSFKQKIIKNWPVILLAIFMAWTSVGCIQAGMEANAEKYIKNHSSGDANYEYYLEIANWTSGDRMTNAADRSWNGCNNLKDGYFSFIFYATVMLNVLMLGNNAENKKKWILRALLITSLLIAVVDIICFLRPLVLSGVIDAARYTFNNSNHFAYYYTVIAIMSVVMFMKEENLYFKGLALFNVILYFFIMIMNNTFGAQIGIGFAMLFLLIVTLIRLISRHKVKEFILYLVTLLLFIFACTSLGSFSYKRYSKNNIPFSITSFRYKLFGSTYLFNSNSFNEEQAIKLKIDNTTLNGKPMEWGTTSTKLPDVNASGDPIIYYSDVEYNINNLVKEAGTLFNFFSKNSKEEVKEETTSSNKTAVEIMTELEMKYPKVSGESLEEFNARQQKIQEEFSKWFKENGETLATPVTTEEKSGNDSKKEDVELDSDVALTGSGRGQVWIRSLDLMNQRPIFGWGLENLLNEFYEQYNVGEGRTHNLLLQLGGCTGIIGVLIYYIATVSIFLKVAFDVKLRKYKRNTLIGIFVVFLILTIALNIGIHKVTDKLLFNGLFTVILWAFLYMCVFFKRVRLRVKDWNYFEMMGSAVFVSYMIGSFFGNSAFYTSPYFMIFLGILLYEMLHKTSRFDEELAKEGADVEIEDKDEEPIGEKNKNTVKSEAKSNNQKKNNKKKKRR